MTTHDQMDPLKFSFLLSQVFGLNRIIFTYDNETKNQPRQIRVKYLNASYLLCAMTIYALVLVVLANEMCEKIPQIGASDNTSLVLKGILILLIGSQNVQILAIILYNYFVQKHLGEQLVRVFAIDKRLFKYYDTHVSRVCDPIDIFAYRTNHANLTYVAMSFGVRALLYTLVFRLNCVTVTLCCLPPLGILIFRLWYADVMQLVQQRVHLVNQMIAELALEEAFFVTRHWYTKDESYGSSGAERVVPADKRVPKVFGGLAPLFKLDLLLDVQDECIAVAQELFAAFEGQIFINFSLEYLQVTCYTYIIYIYSTYTEEFDAWPFCGWLFAYWLFGDFYEMNIVISISNDVMQCIKQTGVYLHKLHNSVSNLELLDNIRMYSLIYLHKHVTLIALGVIEINFSFIDTIIRTVVTYWVIIVQYDHTKRLSPLIKAVSALENSEMGSGESA